MTDSLQDLMDYLAELQDDIEDNQRYLLGRAGKWPNEADDWPAPWTDEDIAMYHLGLDDRDG